MNTQIISRLLWQIPVLVFLVACLTPSVSWDSSVIGAWPVWLLSMPLLAFTRHVLLNNEKKIDIHSIKSAQLLVFKSTNPALHSKRAAQKRAA